MTSRKLQINVESTHYQDYEYRDAAAPCTSAYLLKQLAAFCGDLRPGTRVLDVGSGNGFLAGSFLNRGCRFVGIDLSTAGVEIARLTYPEGRFEVLSADDKILENLGEQPFDIVVSTEVVEHLYSPRSFARGCFAALKPGGRFLCTTPYHGYVKNLLICLLNRFDTHFNPLWEGGHIKFWTTGTLSSLLLETGFRNPRFRGAGRVPLLWKSMIVAADKPPKIASVLDEVTVLILTYNEAPNIDRVLDKLRWASRIVVVDSFSTDGTVAMANRFPNVRVIQRRFDSFAQQCNFGLEQIGSPWVLSLDADYVLSDELLDEMSSLVATDVVTGYRVRFRYCIHGRPLRSSLYPARTVLYRKDNAQYRDDGHGHALLASGETRMLSGWIDHDDRKGLDRWLSEQNRYMIIEARKLLETPMESLNLADRLRRWIVPAPLLVFFYTLFVKGLILDRWPGWYYVFQRTLAEILLSLRLIEAKLVGQRGAD